MVEQTSDDLHFMKCPYCKKLLWNNTDTTKGRKVRCPLCGKLFRYRGFSILHSLSLLLPGHNECTITLSEGRKFILEQKPQPVEPYDDIDDQNLDYYLRMGLDYFTAQEEVSRAIKQEKEYIEKALSIYQANMKAWEQKVQEWNRKHPNDMIKI